MSEKLKMIFWGILAALGALALESLLMLFATGTNPTETSSTAPWFMPTAVIIEELFSLALIAKLFQNSPPGKDAFFLALFFGVGFSVPEILLNYFNFSSLSQDILLAYLGLLLVHTATAGLFGRYFFHKTTITSSIILLLLLAIAVHLAFNFSILFNLNVWLSLSLPTCVIIASFLSTKTHLLKTPLPS